MIVGKTITNNTNVTAKWELDYTAKIAKEISDEQVKKLGITDEEVSKWQEIADKMYLPEDKELGIFVQHDGF